MDQARVARAHARCRPARAHTRTDDGSALSQNAPDPGWYPDPAGSGGVRWWDGLGWTEHVAVPEGEPEQDHLAEVVYMEVARAAKPTLADDGEIHPRARELVFAGAARGTVPTIAERMRPRELLTGLLGVQLLGLAAIVLLLEWIGVRGVLHDGGGFVPGWLIGLGVLLPVFARHAVREQVRQQAWVHWALSRGLEPGAAEGAGRIVPAALGRSPLFGPQDDRVIERVVAGQLAGRDAVVGTVLHLTEAVGLDPDETTDPLRTRNVHRSTFVAMPLPPLAAERWAAGASIRADHRARRPMHLRAMLGSLVARPAEPDAHSHLSVQPGQDPHLAMLLADARYERYLAQRPLDADIVEDLLVVMRDGVIEDAEQLDELCRDALVLHERLVPEQELPAARAAAMAQAAAEQEARVEAAQRAADEEFAARMAAADDEGYAEAA